MQLNIGKRTVSTTVRLSFSADSVGWMKNFCEIWKILCLAAGRGLQIYLIMESQQIYYTPKVEVLEMCQEGVLCGSNEIVDENIGEW